MQKVKILHCGDLHFDTPFGELSYEKGEKRKEDLRETFGKIIECIKTQKIELLLMSGDLFDNKRVMKTTLDYMKNKFNEIPDTKVFICPGNHDPYDEKSFYHILQWPSNVYIFGKTVEKVVIDELNTCVYGIGFSKSYERKSLIENFCVEDEKYINIMVLHGDVVNLGQSSDYNPITMEDIKRSKLDYLALGHVHKHLGVMRCENTFYSYSGCSEGRGFDELGEKGVLIGEVGKGYCNMNFHPISKRKYFVEYIDIGQLITYEEIIKRIQEKIEDIDKKENLYKIHLTGEIPEGFSINTSVVEEKLKKDFFYVKILDQTQLEVDYDALEKIFSLKGIFVRNMREKIKQTSDAKEKQQLIKALKMGMKALADEEVDDK